MTRRPPLSQQVIAIAGTASGIGRETALQAARQGASLVISDFDEAGLASLVQEIRTIGAPVEAVPADVADYAQVQAVASAAVTRFGRLDTWIHVAATSIYATVLDTTPDEFRRVIEVDLLGQIHGAKAALPYLIQTGGGLIHISSVEARRTFPYHSAYGAAKHGIDGFIEALRVELAHQRIPVSVTQILPASINTPFFDKAVTKLGVKPKGVPPFYSPSVVAGAILYAAQHPQRDVIVGGAGKAILLTQRLSPGLLDLILRQVGFTLQRTDDPRSPNSPNDLFAPAGMYNRVQGDFPHQTFHHSVYTWLHQHPAVQLALAGSAAGAVALLRSRARSGAPAARQ